MANRTAAPLLLRVGDKPRLEQLLRSTRVSAGLASRARVVLLAADWVANHDIAAQVGVSRPTVNRWRSRYAALGMAGLSDAKRPGRPRRVDQSKIITETLKPPPPSLGVTHWSSRLLAGRVGVDHATVAATWKDYGVRPWRAETFKFSTDPELVAKVTDIIGLYLHPRAPRGADDSSGGERPSPPDLSQQGW